jgi:hypothetical protein
MSFFVPVHITFLTSSYHLSYHFMSLFLPVHNSFLTASYRFPYHFISVSYQFISLFVPIHVGSLTSIYRFSYQFISVLVLCYQPSYHSFFHLVIIFKSVATKLETGDNRRASVVLLWYNQFWFFGYWNLCCGNLIFDRL